MRKSIPGTVFKKLGWWRTYNSDYVYSGFTTGEESAKKECQ